MDASKIDITILVDNQAGPGLTTEHGFSLWIETDDRHILFDTGQGPALPSNARALGVDLRKTDVLVLSHGHYDHTGGIPHVLHVAPNAHVYCHPGVVQPRYSLRNGSPKPAHMPSESMAALGRLPEKHPLRILAAPSIATRKLAMPTRSRTISPCGSRRTRV
jgi:7,8-dihydropterin-6-yl-methyl-4-(beta-D-ribofuranosyl)aminobenzene 5'-phosphate synthase